MLDSTNRDNSRRPSAQPFNIKNPSKKRKKGGAGTLYSATARAAHEEAKKANAKAEEDRVAAFVRREQRKNEQAQFHRHRHG